jgi:hypothetical protein
MEREKQIMKPVQVRATRVGFYMHRLQQPGEVFVMDENDVYQKDAKGVVKKDDKGKPALCTWIELAPGRERSERSEKIEGKKE